MGWVRTNTLRHGNHNNLTSSHTKDKNVKETREKGQQDYSTPVKSRVMLEEARRDAIGTHHFVSGTRKKVFICNDRREYKNLQGEMNQLEKKKAYHIKKYDDEIKDWKAILKQLRNEKEGR